MVGSAGDVDVVLDREGNAVERQLGGAAALELGGARLELGARRELDPGRVLAAARDALQDGRYELRRPQPARGMACFECKEVERVGALQHAGSLL